MIIFFEFFLFISIVIHTFKKYRNPAHNAYFDTFGARIGGLLISKLVVKVSQEIDLWLFCFEFDQNDNSNRRPILL